MGIKDLMIGRQLGLGLGLMLALVGVLSTLAWWQADSMWQETKRLYEHPFTVSRALSEVREHTHAMQLGLKDLLQTSPENQQQIVQAVQAHDVAASRQFDILYGRYLGPRSDVDEALRGLSKSRSNREEIIDLLRLGRRDEAAARAKQAEAAGGLDQDFLRRLQVLRDFANRRADSFYHDALRHKDALLTRLAIVSAAIIMLALGISYVLARNIRKPLEELAGTAVAYRQGDPKARCAYAAGNEFGQLAQTFNSLLDTVQAQSRRRENAALLTQAMLREEHLKEFCRQLLQALLESTDSQAGTVYLLSGDGRAYESFESIGMGHGGRASFAVNEGQLGAALASGQPQVIADIPDDTPYVFATACGDFRPRSLLTIPIRGDGQTPAIFCLASLHSYGPEALELVDDVLVAMSARMGGVLALREARRLAAQLEEQNRELEAQQRELAAQAAELSQQNLELEMQKQQLDQANRLKSSFLANMSHELRTPLNSVIALSEVLERRLTGAIPAEEHGYLEVIARNGKSLLALINNLLDLSRIEAGREEIRSRTFLLPALVAEVMDTLRPQAQEKGLALVATLAEGLPPLVSDPEKLRHILMNLAVNAVKFTDAGRVVISASQEQGGMRIMVSDTGIGISDEHLPHIFDEFRQADDSASRRHGGTGLGLSIAKKYATLLGGTISVQSHLGQGSVFSLDLPLALPEAKAGPEPATADPGRPTRRQSAVEAFRAGPGRRILVVEDSEPIIVQMTDILVGQGYEVVVARDGREALAQVAWQRPDAMILDLMMPEVDGFQVLKEMRSSPGTSELPVLILTAKHVTAEELSFLQGNHIHELIQKGDVSREQLLAAIAAMLPPA